MISHFVKIKINLEMSIFNKCTYCPEGSFIVPRTDNNKQFKTEYACTINIKCDSTSYTRFFHEITAWERRLYFTRFRKSDGGGNWKSDGKFYIRSKTGRCLLPEEVGWKTLR